MRAVILAAGRGGRLQGAIGDQPKCLARVGHRTLLDRQVAALRSAGISDITVVAGYGLAQVQRTCPPDVDVVVNPDYGTTNSLYSLWLVREQLRGGFLVMNCDVLFHPQLLADLLSSRFADAVLVSARGDEAEYGDEEMKVCIRRGLVRAMAKTLRADESDAENVGIARFSAEGAEALIDVMQGIVGTGAVREWLPRAFAAFSELRPLRAIDTRGYPWIEIDFPEDYWRACSEVLPAIEALAPPGDAPASLVAGRTWRHV